VYQIKTRCICAHDKSKVGGARAPLCPMVSAPMLWSYQLLTCLLSDRWSEAVTELFGILHKLWQQQSFTGRQTRHAIQLSAVLHFFNNFYLMDTFHWLYCMQVAALPYIQTAVATSRNKANRALGVLEPWQIAACTVFVTLVVVWIFDFLFRHDESMHRTCAVLNQCCDVCV